MEPYRYEPACEFLHAPAAMTTEPAWSIVGPAGHVALLIGPEWVALDAVIAMNRRIRNGQRITRVRMHQALEQT